MSVKLPFLSQAPLPAPRGDLLGALAEEWDEADGYVFAEGPGDDILLFVRGGKVWCAGTFHDDRPSGVPLGQALSKLRGTTRAVMRETDLPLFLCMAVLVRKAPSATLPVGLIDSEQILQNIRNTGKDAVLVVQRGDAFSLAFCRGGEPVALYPAEGETFASDGSVADRIAEYLYSQPTGGDAQELTLLLYDEIKLPAASDARPMTDLASGYATQPPEELDDNPPLVVVRLAGRVVFRYPVTREETLVGRGDEADLALDNLSVSRRHLLLRKTDEGLVAEDLGSENGIVCGGERVERAELSADKPVEVGKYTLELAHADDELSEMTEPAVPISRAPGLAAEKTISVDRAGGRATLEHNGTKVQVKGLALSIGAGPRAGLKLRGLFIGDINTVIRRASEGFIAEQVGGLRRLHINGAATKRAVLADGDELSIASHTMRVRIEA